jgi:hypothetical protein
MAARCKWRGRHPATPQFFWRQHSAASSCSFCFTKLQWRPFGSRDGAPSPAGAFVCHRVSSSFTRSAAIARTSGELKLEIDLRSCGSYKRACARTATKLSFAPPCHACRGTAVPMDTTWMWVSREPTTSRCRQPTAPLHSRRCSCLLQLPRDLHVLDLCDRLPSSSGE